MSEGTLSGESKDYRIINPNGFKGSNFGDILVSDPTNQWVIDALENGDIEEVTE